MTQYLKFDTFQEYRQHPGINASLLKDLRKSPLNAFGVEVVKESAALDFGRMYHEFILEPETFKNNYFAFDENERPEPDRTFATKANKAWKAEQIEKAAEQNKQIVTLAELTQMQVMRENLRAYAAPAIDLIKLSNCEASIYTEVALNDGERVPVKARFDVINPERGAIMDLKTTQDATPKGFEVQAGKYAYHVQVAFYLMVAEKVFKRPFKFFFLTQETKAPYNTLLREVTPEMREKGERELIRLLPAAAKIKQTGEIKSYNVFTNDPLGILPLDIPEYYVQEHEFNI